MRNNYYIKANLNGAFSEYYLVIQDSSDPRIVFSMALPSYKIVYIKEIKTPIEHLKINHIHGEVLKDAIYEIIGHEGLLYDE